MRGIFDPSYRFFMYEDMMWLPLILIFGGLPMAAVFVGVNVIVLRLYRILRK